MNKYQIKPNAIDKVAALFHKIWFWLDILFVCLVCLLLVRDYNDEGEED